MGIVLDKDDNKTNDRSVSHREEVEPRKKYHWHLVQRKSSRSLDFGNLAVRQTKIYVDDVAR